MKKVFYAVAIFATLSLASCGSKQNADDTTNTQEVEVMNETEMIEGVDGPAAELEAAGAEVEQGVADAGDAMEDAAAEAKAKGKDAIEAAKEKGKEAVDAAKDKAAAAAADAKAKAGAAAADAKAKAADALQRGADRLRK